MTDIINQPVQFDHCQLNISISIGEAIFPNDDQDFESLFVHSDEEMYKQKLQHPLK